VGSAVGLTVAGGVATGLLLQACASSSRADKTKQEDRTLEIVVIL